MTSFWIGDVEERVVVSFHSYYIDVPATLSKQTGKTTRLWCQTLFPL
jgi:hypothetical protein